MSLVLKTKEIRKAIYVGVSTCDKTRCLNCANPRCMQIEEKNTICSSLTEIASSADLSLCPTKAISVDQFSIKIDSEKCIGCGLCVVACPVGAISMKNDKAIVDTKSESSLKELEVNPANIIIQEEYIAKCTVEKSVCYENDALMEKIFDGIKHLSQEKQNALVRNILIMLGNNATITRKGVVYMRMDGFYQNSKKKGVFEVETGADLLDVSRAILDDIAVLNVRHKIKVEEETPLAICLGFPNKRTDYWQVVKDIKDITGIKIQTITIGALLLLMWNNKCLEDMEGFYVDVDNTSIREIIEKCLGRKANISNGMLGMLEIQK